MTTTDHTTWNSIGGLRPPISLLDQDRKHSIALVLQGGGARGAYQAGVLKAIAEMKESKVNPFRVLCGESVGALNAASLAAGATEFRTAAGTLESLWRGLSSNAIYETGLGKIARSAFVHAGPRSTYAVLDNSPFRSLLTHAFKPRHVAHAISSGALDALCVTASSYSVGRAVTFYEASEHTADWHRVRRDGIHATIGVEHLLASSALPLLFPSVCIQGSHYGDGALRSRAPLSPAIRMGADRILVIGVRDREPDPMPVLPITHPTPSPGAIGGQLLDILFNDSLDSDIERLVRINETLRLLSPDTRQRTTLREIDVLALYPSQDIRTIAEEYRQELPRSIRFLLRRIGVANGHGQLLSYLLFEPGFINALIELGKADAFAQRDAIVAFLSATQPA